MVEKKFLAKNPMENTTNPRKVGFVGWIVFFFVKKLAFFERKIYKFRVSRPEETETFFFKKNQTPKRARDHPPLPGRWFPAWWRVLREIGRLLRVFVCKMTVSRGHGPSFSEKSQKRGVA